MGESNRAAQDPSKTHSTRRTVLQTQCKSSFGQQLPLTLDLAWLHTQFPEPPGKGSTKNHATKGVDIVQHISPYKRERNAIVKRELIEQGLMYGLGFVFVVAALPLLRYIG